jgi:BirA family biotin operon repressor/biotin-[acetyl-CoA-carboxylase] ligase
MDGKKFGGILTETGVVKKNAGNNPFVVIGVGLNIFSPEEGFPEELQGRATALSEYTEAEISTEKLLEVLCVALESEVKRLEDGNFDKILEEWSLRDAIKDKKLNWVTPKGKVVTGVSLGPDADGLLRVKDDEGTIHSVISGDVKLVENFPESLAED